MNCHSFASARASRWKWQRRGARWGYVGHEWEYIFKRTQFPPEECEALTLQNSGRGRPPLELIVRASCTSTAATGSRVAAACEQLHSLSRARERTLTARCASEKAPRASAAAAVL